MDSFGLLVIAILLSFYGVACSIECGFALSSLYPGLSTNSKTKLFRFNLKWHYSNILMFAITLIAFLLIQNTKLNVSDSIQNYLIVILIFLILKVLVSLLIRKEKSKEISSPLKLLNLIFSYLVPISYSALGIYLIIGHHFWQNFVGISLILATVLGISVIGISSFNTLKIYSKNASLRQSIDALFAIWVVVLGFVVPIVFQHFNSTLIGVSLSVLEIVIIASVFGYSITSIKQKKPNELYHYAYLIGFSVPILLAWNNRPYFLNQKIFLSKIFMSSSYSSSYYWLIFIVLILSFVAIALIINNISEFLDGWTKIKNISLKKKVH